MTSTFPTTNNTNNKLKILSEENRRETVGKGGWERKDWKGKSPVVLIFGVPSDMTRIEFKTKCDEVGLYYFAIGKVERNAEHFRVMLTPKTRTEWQKTDK